MIRIMQRAGGKLVGTNPEQHQPVARVGFEPPPLS